MRTSILTGAFVFAVGFVYAAEKSAPSRASTTVILTEIGVKNLRLESVQVEESDFEETLFALGGIEPVPGKVAAVSTRVPGRILELKCATGDRVQAAQEVAVLESRQPGDPPPSIRLKSPIGGLVTRVETRLGDPLEPDKALLEVVDLSEVLAVAHVPEHQVGRLKPGTVAHITVPALNNAVFDAELSRFGTAADKQTGTLEAVFRLRNPDGLLLPSMRVEFSMVLNKREGVTSVPRAALQGEPANRFVFVEDFDLKNAFVKTPVEVGQINDRFVEILSGLLPGDKVITRGAYSLAFAGGGSVSLKEALDAAHGHEHAADGSELKPGEHATKSGGGNSHEHHHHHGESGHEDEGEVLFWKCTSGVLFVALFVSLRLRRRASGVGGAK